MQDGLISFLLDFGSDLDIVGELNGIDLLEHGTPVDEIHFFFCSIHQKLKILFIYNLVNALSCSRQDGILLEETRHRICSL